MNIHLIPQPQYAQVHDTKVISGLKHWHVTLRVPLSDPRLSSLARSLFAGVEEIVEPGSSYALVTEGLPFNPVLTQRIAQRNDGYILIIDAHCVEMASDCASGLFYALKTLEELLRSGEGNVPALTIADWADLRLRSEYLDLRTVYPKFELMLEYIAELSRYKINTLVVEYEDKLPFRRLSFLRHPELAFTEEQHRKLLAVAEQNFIRIIPKQQSFGHLEYILKHPSYIGFRETPAAVGELCPHRQGSLEMMAGILEEIAALHPGSEYLHLGCDEVWSLGTCEDCRTSGLTREASFIFFVNQLVDITCGLGKKPIIWHDMLIHASDEELSVLDKRVIVAVWIYGGHRMKADARHILRKLRKAGLEVLGASAVRCWDDNGDQNYPVIPNRIQNVLSWVQLSQSEQLDGMINTNWACPFSLGSPYGLFETSRYPAFFAADHNWNVHADTSTYLKRFLHQYHGMNVKNLPEDEWADYVVTDYYALIPQLLQDIADNRPTAELIDAMIQYELPSQRRFPLHTFLFRGVLSSGSEEVITCLKEKYRVGYGDLINAKQSMETVLNKLLPPQMVQLFIMSRFYRLELFEDRLSEMIVGLERMDGRPQNNRKAGNTHA